MLKKILISLIVLLGVSVAALTFVKIPAPKKPITQEVSL